MGRFFEDITSAYWWIAVVIVGILINLASAYLKPWLESAGSSLSRRYRNRVESRRRAHEAYVSLLRSDNHLQVLGGFNEMRCRLRSVIFIVTGLGFLTLSLALLSFLPLEVIESSTPLVVAGLVLTSLSTMMVLAGLRSHQEAMRQLSALDDAKDPELRGTSTALSALDDAKDPELRETPTP